jgi:hypothetical protein
MFVPDKPLLPCIMFEGKARNLPERGVPHSGRLWSYPQTLELPVTYLVSLSSTKKKSDTLTPGVNVIKNFICR